MKSGLSVLTIFLLVAKCSAIQLLLNNVDPNGNAGFIVQNVSQAILDETKDIATSLVLIEYDIGPGDKDFDDKINSCLIKSLCGGKRRRRSVSKHRPLRCLGNLISPNYVVTAASCVKYTGEYIPVSVRLADNRNIGIASDGLIWHDDYRANIPENLEAANTNNIALIKLNTEVAESKLVTFINYMTPPNVDLVTITWHFLDDGVLPTDATSHPGWDDNEKYNFETAPEHVYAKKRNSPTLKYLTQIIADGGVGTMLSEYVEWIENQSNDEDFF